jgi:uncharacterized protein YndB with AHSA1/START domain
VPELFPCEHVGLDFIDTARFCSRNSVDLAVPPEQLWQVLEDPETWPTWSPVSQMTWTSAPPLRLGSTRAIKMRNGAAIEEVIAWKPHSHLAFRMNKCSNPAEGASVEEHVIERTAQGCRLTWTLAHDPINPRLRDKLLAKHAMRVKYTEYLTKLRSYTDLRFGTTI